MRELNIYIDADRPGGPACLVESLASMDRVGAFYVMRRDRHKVRVFFLRKGASVNVAPTRVAMDAGTTLVFAGKKASAPNATTVLFQAALQEVSDSDDGIYYEGIVNFNTTELISATSGLTSALAILADIQLQSDDEDPERLTYQFRGAVGLDIYTGSESDPTPATPAYPLAADVLSTANMATADLPEGVDEADIDISALGLEDPPTRVMACLLIPAGQPVVGVLAATVLSATAVRIYLTGPTPTDTCQVTLILK